MKVNVTELTAVVRRAREIDLNADEKDTKRRIITPVLKALGCGISMEYLIRYRNNRNRKNGRVDYALREGEHSRKPSILVEAKGIGVSLDNPKGHPKTTQISEYCMESGVANAVLTNGRTWRFYALPSRVRVSPVFHRLYGEIDIFDGQAEERAKDLSEMFNRLVTEEHWIPIGHYEPFKGEKPPAKIKFQDGETSEPKRWYGLMHSVIEWLWSNGSLTREIIPVRASVNTHIVSLDPRHADGRPFRKPGIVPNIDATLFVEEHVSSGYAVRCARTLLQHCGQSTSGVYIQAGNWP